MKTKLIGGPNSGEIKDLDFDKPFYETLVFKGWSESIFFNCQPIQDPNGQTFYKEIYFKKTFHFSQSNAEVKTRTFFIHESLKNEIDVFDELFKGYFENKKDN